MKICNKCGATVEDNYIFCNKCGNKLDDTPQQPNPTINQPAQPQIQYVPVSTPAPEPPKKKRKWWIIVLVVLAIFVFVYTFGSSDDAEPTSNNNSSSTTSAESTTSKSELINSCKEYTYKEIARDPNNYKGKPAKFKGEVIQVQESGNKVVLRVDITAKANEFAEGGYLYEDTIYVEYTRKNDTESRILEEDIVTMYGTLNGLKTYESIFGEEISIPLFNAEYIDIEAK